MAKNITSEKLIKLGDGNNPVRLSFLNAYKTKAFKGNAPKFSATGLMDPSNKIHQASMAELKAETTVLLQQGGLNKQQLDALCFGDGTKKFQKNPKTYEAYNGKWYVVSSNTADNRPHIRNRLNKPVNEGEPGAPYAGAYGILGVTLWLQDNEWGKKINANFIIVQFVKDGEKFGGNGVDVDGAFQALDEGDHPESNSVKQVDDFDF